MLAVVSCNKYLPKTVRIADVGDVTKEEAQAMLDKCQTMECPICGPCSHVELTWKGYLNVHSVHEHIDEAHDAAVALDPETYKFVAFQQTA